MGKQLSVFIRNEAGTLYSLVNCLAQVNIDILSFNLADTESFGIVRLIVDDIEKAQKALEEAGFVASITDVLIVLIPAKPGTLAQLLADIGPEKNISYMYPYSTMGENAGMVVKVEEAEEVAKKLASLNYKFISA